MILILIYYCVGSGSLLNSFPFPSSDEVGLIFSIVLSALRNVIPTTLEMLLSRPRSNFVIFKFPLNCIKLYRLTYFIDEVMIVIANTEFRIAGTFFVLKSITFFSIAMFPIFSICRWRWSTPAFA